MKSYKRGNFRYLVFGIFVAVATLLYGASATSDTGEWLLSARGPSIVKLTPIDRIDTGATGFELRLPSGSQVTVTNAHVCEIVGPDGKMMARWAGGQRPVRVLEISDKTDLCVLEPIMARPALEMAPTFDQGRRIYVLGHPHLRALTLSTGFPVSYESLDFPKDLPLDKCIGPNLHVGDSTDIFGTTQKACIESLPCWESSAQIFPGNSGSPTMNAEGRVVGVMFAGDRRSNYGAFISLTDLREFVSRY